MNVGEIEYTVAVETQQAITASDRIGQSLQGMQGEMEKTDKAADSLNTGLSKLAKGIAAVAVGGLAKNLAQQVQAYNTMAERVKMATESVEEFDMVQQRLRETADGTYRSLSEAQEVFIGTSSALKGMGYSTEQALDVVDSLSYAFVTNATSSQRAESALNALTMATTTGKVTAQQWITLMAAVPSVVTDIAKATGKTESAIRELGATGKLAAKDLAEGLRQSVDANKEAADAMANDFIDAGVRMNGAIVAILAGLEQQTGALDALTNGIIGAANVITDFAQDAEKMAGFLAVAETAAASLAAVMTAKVLTSMVASGKAFYASTIAASAKAAADVKAAQAATVAAAQDLIKAKAAETAAVGMAHHAQMVQALAVAEANATVATKTLTTAISAQAGVMTMTQRAASLLSATMATLGGPAGLIMLAGVALWQFAKYAGEAERELANLEEPLDTVISRMKEMNQLQKDAEVRRWSNSLADAREEVNALALESATMAKKLRNSADEGSVLKEVMAEAARVLGQVAQGGQITSEQLDALGQRISNVAGMSAEAKAALLDKVAALDASYTAGLNAQQTYLAVADAAREVAAETSAAAKSVWELADEMRTGSQSAADYASKMGRALEDAADRTHLGRLMRDIRDNAEAWGTATKAQLDAAVASAVAMDAFEKQSRAAKKATGGTKGLTDAQRAAKKAAEDMARSQESNAKALENLQEQLYQAGLNARDLALRQAELTLNEYATDEQRAQVAALADELYRLNDAKNRASKFGDDVGGSIRGSVSPLAGGRFDDGTARYEAERQAEERRYQEQMERLIEAETLKLEVVGGYDLMREELYQEHIDRMNQIDEARRDAQLDMWSSGFGQMASDLHAFADTFFSENEAMFKVAKAAAIAQTIMDTYKGAQQAFTAMAGIPYVGPALGIAAAAAAVAGGMARVASIRSQSMGGARQYGGGVRGDKYYKVNEGGMPEIFRGSDGNQYLMPNQRGEVVSNKDATAGMGGSSKTMNLTQNITMRQDNGNYTNKQVAMEAARMQSIAEARFG